MHVKVEVAGRVVRELRIPETANDAFRICLEASPDEHVLDVLQKVAVSKSDDPVYGPVGDVGELELLAEVRPTVEAIKEGLKRRLSTPVEEHERIRFR